MTVEESGHLMNNTKYQDESADINSGNRNIGFLKPAPLYQKPETSGMMPSMTPLSCKTKSFLFPDNGIIKESPLHCELIFDPKKISPQNISKNLAAVCPEDHPNISSDSRKIICKYETRPQSESSGKLNTPNCGSFFDRKRLNSSPIHQISTPLKVVKPDPAAFSFSGYMQKSKKPTLYGPSAVNHIIPTPKTPSKRQSKKLLFPNHQTPLFSQLRPPMNTASEHQHRLNNLYHGIRSDNMLNSDPNDEALFSPFLSSDDRDAISPGFCRRMEQSSSLANSSPHFGPSDWTEEPGLAKFDFDQDEDPDDVLVEENSSIFQHWWTQNPHFITLEFFDQGEDISASYPNNPLSIEPAENVVNYFDTEFEVLELNGRGSFADVYKAQWKRDLEIYSVKKTRQIFSGYNDRWLRLQEVKSMLRIGPHPHCLRLVSCWEQQGHLYLQTELCELGSLERLIGQCALRGISIPEPVIWQILLHVALGLKHIHDQGYVHLDIKPANLLINGGGILKIADFGLSQPINGNGNSNIDITNTTESPSATASVATPPLMDMEGDNVYMAPELLEGRMGKPSDIFSLGLVLLEMAANIDLPSQGLSWQHLRHNDFHEIYFDPSISESLVQLIFHMLQEPYEKRPSIEYLISETILHTSHSNDPYYTNFAQHANNGLESFLIEHYQKNHTLQDEKSPFE